mgnify:CR=1 FL=1
MGPQEYLLTYLLSQLKPLCPREVISQHEILLKSVPGCIQAKKAASLLLSLVPSHEF